MRACASGASQLSFVRGAMCLSARETPMMDVCSSLFRPPIDRWSDQRSKRIFSSGSVYIVVGLYASP